MPFTDAEQTAILTTVGVPVTVQQAGQSNLAIRGKFRDTTVIELGTASTDPHVFIKSADFAQFTRSAATLVIGSESYKIRHAQVEQSGFVLLFLKKA